MSSPEEMHLTPIARISVTVDEIKNPGQPWKMRAMLEIIANYPHPCDCASWGERPFGRARPIESFLPKYGGSGVFSVEIDTIHVMDGAFDKFIQYWQTNFNPDVFLLALTVGSSTTTAHPGRPATANSLNFR